MIVAGVDGCPRGWVAVVLADGSFHGALVARSLVEVVAAFAPAAEVAVDMPIGLPRRGRRRADEEARAFIGPRRASLFWTPPLEAIQAETHAEAVAACRAVGAPGISAQCYALRRKIGEARALAEGDGRLFEVHPEVSFRAMKGGPLPPKTARDGLMERTALLEGEGIWVPAGLDLAGAAPDDVLDAAAAAWTAWRKARGLAAVLPADATTDERSGGLLIWY